MVAPGHMARLSCVPELRVQVLFLQVKAARGPQKSTSKETISLTLLSPGSGETESSSSSMLYLFMQLAGKIYDWSSES